MYKTQEERSKLSNLVPRLRGEISKVTPRFNNKTALSSSPYAKKDAKAAKRVLEKLMSSLPDNEILSIRELC